MKKILVPTDFSTEADNALDFAIQLARKLDAEIELLHVIEVPSASLNTTGAGYSSMESIYTVELIKGANERLNDRKESVIGAGIKVTGKIEIGNVYKHIYNNITNEQADIIIQGSKGATGWKEVLIGSNAEKVIRHSHVPVFTIKEKTNINQFKSMVFAVGEPEDQSVAVVKTFQKLFGINCHLLKVYNTTKFSYTHESAKKYVEGFGKQNGFENYTASVIDAPWVEEGVFDFIGQQPTNLIAIGTHGYTGLAHFLNGSRAEDVVNHSKLPVLTVRID